MSKTAHPPLTPRKIRTSVPRKAIQKAVEDLAALCKRDPVAYRALIDSTANTVIRTVPG
jgi:hypothetical protein